MPLPADGPSGLVPPQTALTTRQSVDSAGGQGNAFAHTRVALSSDGLCAAFCGDADNLVPGDTNGVGDIFVRERISGRVERISVDSTGNQANALSFFPSISSPGRWVAFQSAADNLVPGDTNLCEDVFVHDRLTGQTERVSVDSSGVQGNGACSWPSISADGRWVTYFGSASNLVAGDQNQATDVFVRDRASATTRLVSATQGGPSNGPSARPVLSADGRWVAFHSQASNLVLGDTNGLADVFVVEISTGLVERVSLGPLGAESNGQGNTASISGDGQVVAWESTASNLVPADGNGVSDVFVRDRAAATTLRASVNSAGAEGLLPSFKPAVSEDGRWVAFYSEAANLVPGDGNGVADTFLRGLAGGITERVSVDSLGVEADGSSSLPAVSADARFVLFGSFASNLVPGDTNQHSDVFLRDRAPSTVSIYCTAKVNALGCTPSIGAAGAASAGAPAGFAVRATSVRNQKVGMLLYSLTGGSAGPFQGGFLCLSPPIRRVPGVGSGGSSAGNDCSGVFTVDFNAFARGLLGGTPDPSLGEPGTMVEAQWWGRDPGFQAPNNTTLSDALQFTVGV
ncbi:MAG: PD40 domain-containing protein [Planctomycetes bacterium]|nr:PD40 domain-containing protein [Planctomycetota bacterium]